MEKNQYRKEPLKDNVEEMFIGPFGSSLKNECFVDERNAYCMVYEQKHAIQKTLAGKNRFVDRNKYQELKRFTVKPGDIIVSCRGTIGETFIIPENAPLGIMHPSIMKIRLKPNVYNIEYFNLLLKSRLEAYNKSANGSGVKMAISATELGKDLFPIPPMDEQQKISRIFFMVEHLILLRKQQLAKMDELVKARFVEMFGTFPANPFRWSTGKIQDVVSDVRYGSSRPAVEGGKYPYLRMNNITYSGELDLHDTKRIDIPDSELDKCTVRRGDVLFNRTNSKELVGKTCVYNRDELMVLAGFVIRVRVNERIRPEVLSAFLNMDFSKRMLIGMCKTAIGQANINAKELQNIDLYIPPIELQDQFVTLKNKIDQQKQTVQQSLEKLELLKKSLMQEYFG